MVLVDNETRLQSVEERTATAEARIAELERHAGIRPSATIAWAVDREGPGKAKLPALTG